MSNLGITVQSPALATRPDEAGKTGFNHKEAVWLLRNEGSVTLTAIL